MILGTASLMALAGVAKAEVPSVVADIPPVHSLVAMVMGDLGAPDLLVQPGASPHGYSLRPSEARALERAQAVFWMGTGLEPWLEKSIDALAADAQVIELPEIDGTTELEFREGATFDAHDHEHEDHADHDDHDHDHDDHDHEHEEAHDDEGHDHADDHGHDDHDEHAEEDTAHHEDHDEHGHDPHAWLDPQNAQVWLDAIAKELAALDPDNAATYRANAEAGKAELTGLIADISAQLDPVRDRTFVVFHDAYHYFENRFAFYASGSISLSDASAPSPARIQEVQTKIQDLGVRCAFAEPQYDPDLVQTVFRGTEAKSGVIDPLGADLAPGATLYPQMLRNLATGLVDCLK